MQYHMVHLLVILHFDISLLFFVAFKVKVCIRITLALILIPKKFKQ